MTTYTAYKNAWRTACARDGIETCTRRYLIVSRQTKFVPVCALAYAAREALDHMPLRVSLIRRVQMLCMLSHTDALTLFANHQALDDAFKQSDNGGCAPEDALWLTADFVREYNGFGTGNPLFYAAYLVGTFSRIAPFTSENLPCALALSAHYFLSHNLAPIVFFDDMRQEFESAVRVYMEQENVHALQKAFLSTLPRSAQTLCLPLSSR